MLLLKVVSAYIVLLGSVVFHEYFHAWMGQKLGDDSPPLLARLTLDPRPHIDVFGTLVLPLIALISQSPFLIGWAKPVPINPYNLKNPKKDMILIGISGPLTNFILAFCFTILFKTGIIPPHSLAESFVTFAILLNLILGIFNLIPLSPLDGSHILAGLLSDKAERQYMKIQPFAIYILLFMFLTGMLRFIILPIVYIWTNLFNINFITPALSLLGR
ncbi:MAG: site-2 protease family protein [Candidatus Omnitrophica bacterium]|nr:site-2 protease family protein [Candidatus Omnitrophota bacterium]MBU1048323.1 site-2 protease family protein [Candidatus Omnitrophota bacterium]MBU1630290.1 site-2 protease family protein [Candidatus Omnitrophota bacterium]